MEVVGDNFVVALFQWCSDENYGIMKIRGKGGTIEGCGRGRILFKRMGISRDKRAEILFKGMCIPRDGGRRGGGGVFFQRMGRSTDESPKLSLFSKNNLYFVTSKWPNVFATDIKKPHSAIIRNIHLNHVFLKHN